MACYHPLLAVRGKRNTIRILGAKFGAASVEAAGNEDVIELPCGQCIGCRLNRSYMWAVRCVHEAQMYDHNCFVTLTYDTEKMDSWSLQYSDFQKFMKRLRRVKPGVRFFACGEYGDVNGRPHFHAILFNCFFSDRKAHGKSDSGAEVWISDELDSIWTHGQCHIGSFSYESAAYVARYAVKSALGGFDGKRRAVGAGGFVDAETGEYWSYVPEMIRMSNGGGKSKQGGIGASWFALYHGDCLPRDYVIINGEKKAVPRYYMKLYNEMDTFDAEMVKFKRILRAERPEVVADNTVDRLSVKEVVSSAAIKFKRE